MPPTSVPSAIAAAFADDSWSWDDIDEVAAALAVLAEHPDDRRPVAAFLETLRASDRAHVVIRRRRGEAWDTVLIRAIVVSRDDDGQPTRVVATASEVDRGARPSQLDDRIAGAQRLESLGVLAGGIAHDFNNLLMAVLAEASVAKEDPELPPGARESLDQIELAAQRMAELTRQLLAYAGRGRFVVERLDPDAVIQALTVTLRRSIRRDARLSIRLGDGPSPAMIEADPSQLRQVVTNLVSNASDALGPNGGQITVRSWTERATAAHPATWVCEVDDDGVGMDAATRARIFDPFFTTKPSGHGLGLSAVIGIVHRLGGTVDVASMPGDGARFTVRVPITGVPPVTERRPTQPGAPRLTGLRVLIADDEDAVRSSMRKMLEHRGAVVIEATDGASARTALHSDRFDLVFLDVTMPFAGAYDLLPDARALQPEAPVIVMSGYSESFTTRRVTFDELRDDGDVFLQKPFTLAAFDAALQQLLT